MKSKHGLVIGKFYPPHAGHHLLVRTAAAVCERVSVVVMASHVESIPLDVRVGWMKTVHAADGNVTVTGIDDDHPIDLEDDAIWRAHVALMLEAASKVNDAPIDAVFTSEAYGPELARRLGARHVAIDPERSLAPVSSTAVRREPAASWVHLAAPVRAGLARRVVIVGAESTGKSTLAEQLAAALRARGGAFGLTRCVHEQGREYTIALVARERARAQLEDRTLPALEDLPWTSTAFEHVAAKQNEREDAEAAVGGPILICDTDAFATSIWHERYIGKRSASVEALARNHSLYLLTHHEDAAFVQDGLRDGEHVREWMTNAFAQRLTQTQRHWKWLRGDYETRLRAALAEVDTLLASGSGITNPLG